MRLPDDHMVVKIKDCLHDQESDILQLLDRLVKAESPSSVIIAQDQPLSLISSELEKDGYYCCRLGGCRTGGLLYGRPAQTMKKTGRQLLLGHCDTVWPLGTIREMPWSLDGEKITGPGVYDMKAGLVQIVFACRTLYRLGLNPLLLPLVLINSDEEIGSRESTLWIRRLARISQRAFVLEPPMGLDGKLKTARKGISRFTITIHGKAAHAGLDPEKGLNAIVEMSRIVQQLIVWNEPEKGITVNVGTIEGGISPNVVAPMSRIHLDVRVLTAMDMKNLSSRIHSLQTSKPGFEIQVEESKGRPPMERTARNQKLWKLARKAGKRINLPLKEATAGGGSDGNTTSCFTATLDGLGTTGDGAHARHEFIFRKQLLERTLLLTVLLMTNGKD